MNILVIDDDREKYASIFSTFEEDPVNAFYFCEAPNDSEEEYLAGLVKIVKEADISAILSLSYYRFISLACGVLKIPYLCWIVKGYEESSFDKTINNPWNHIFCADYDTFEILDKANISYLKFLPLSYNASAVEKRTPTKEVLAITDDIVDYKSSTLQFDLLKDSSKGYLDSNFHSRKADLREKPLFDLAAVYLREDVEKCYPLACDDLEPKGHKYDYQLFYPMLNDKTPHIMLYHITASWIKKKCNVDVLTRSKVTDVINHDSLTYYTREDTGRTIEYGNYKLIICFPHREKQNIISEEMLEIMASNSMLLLPGYMNSKLLEDTGVAFFRNRYELAKLIDKYLYDDDARADAVKKSNSYANSVLTYKEALNTILSF